ncbi:hypothetical protein [Paenibacillus chitinolyticus]
MEPDDPAAQYFADTGYIGHSRFCGLMVCRYLWNECKGVKAAALLLL